MPKRLTLEEAEAGLNLTTDFIPAGASNRPGKPMAPSYVTVHETANEKKGADALSHAKYLKGDGAQKRKVSWHYTVDDHRCIKHLPSLEQGWHAGKAAGNQTSVGVEICVNQDGNFAEATERAARLIAVLCFRLSIPGTAVVPHHHWTGKDCPHHLLAQKGVGWAKFQARVQELLAEFSP